MFTGKPSRRDFMKTASAITVGTSAPVHILSHSVGSPIEPTYSANDKIRLATIGMGTMGFGDTRTALLVPGVELVAVADCYEGRLQRAKEIFGESITTTRDFREILSRPDIDAVVIATPDHWHAQIATEAMRSGKDIYLEKPIVHDLEEGAGLIQTQKDTGSLVQVGSQRVSSIAYEKAGELFRAGAIGTLNMVEAFYNRNSALGAWQYSIPTDASPETVDWKRFLGNAPKRSFDATRFFRWRNYWDYGSGVAGDLFVHLFSGVHFVVSAKGPSRVFSTGGLRHWKDGRDVPDVMMSLFDYSRSESHPEFNMSLQVNFADGSGGGEHFRFIGDEGMMTIRNSSVTLSRLATRGAPGYGITTFSAKQQKEFLDSYRGKYPETEKTGMRDNTSVTYAAPRGYSDRLDHFRHFFNAIRSGGSLVEDSTFGLRAAAPALLCNLSYQNGRAFSWDPEAMRISSAQEI